MEEFWKKKDYETARKFLSEHEDREILSTVLEAGRDVTVILPYGLPAIGVTFHGVFMAAPLVLFCVVLILFPIVGFLNGWAINVTSILIIGGCLVLIYGLTRAFVLLIKNRDLFPRKHFATLSPSGIAGHYAIWQSPSGGRGAIEWEKIKTVERCMVDFIPALFFGVISTDAIVVSSYDGAKVFLPVFRNYILKDTVLKEIKEAIIRRQSCF